MLGETRSEHNLDFIGEIPTEREGRVRESSPKSHVLRTLYKSPKTIGLGTNLSIGLGNTGESMGLRNPSESLI
jgi:hypothetical protein